MKREYAKLHDRYSELFKTHIDYMERTKSALGQERCVLHAEKLGYSDIYGNSVTINECHAIYYLRQIRAAAGHGHRQEPDTQLACGEQQVSVLFAPLNQ